MLESIVGLKVIFLLFQFSTTFTSAVILFSTFDGMLFVTNH